MANNTATKRYIPTRVSADKSVPARYRRSGWLVFDTKRPISCHLFVNTKAEAKAIADGRNAHEPEETR